MRIIDWSSDVCSSDLYDFGSVGLTSATSYLRYSNKSLVDYTVVGLPAGTLTDRISSNKVFTQEASLNSTGSGDWRWSVGVFYRHDKDGLEIGRAHVCTPVTNANIVCRLLLQQHIKKR